MCGKFIVFEGIDGSGKSTQYKLFYKRLGEKGYDVFETHEPTNEMIGTLIRNRINSKNNLPGDVNGVIYGLLFYADRIEHNHAIKKALDEGKFVVSDRYYHSSLTYQKTQGTDFNFLIELHKKLLEKEYIKKPDVTFFIDIDPEEALKRIDKRNKQKVEIFEHLEFLKKLRENYLSLVNLLDENLEIIDGTGSVEEVQERIWEAWKKYE